MAIESILAQIDAEIARLTRARALLSGAGTARTAQAVETTAAPKRRGRKRRVLSAEARKRIADAQRRRWAAQKAKKAK